MENGGLLGLYFMIDRVCFNHFLRSYSPQIEYAKLDTLSSGAYGCIPYPYIKIRAGMSERETITALYHEMLHHFAHIKGIREVEPGIYVFHNSKFAKLAEENGGICKWADDNIGWNDAEPAPANFEKILTGFYS